MLLRSHSCFCYSEEIVRILNFNDCLYECFPTPRHILSFKHRILIRLPRERNECTWIRCDYDSLPKFNEIQEHPKRTNMTEILCITFIIRIIPQGLTQHQYMKRSKERVNPKERHFQAAPRARIPVRKLGLVSQWLRWRTELSWAELERKQRACLKEDPTLAWAALSSHNKLDEEDVTRVCVASKVGVRECACRRTYLVVNCVKSDSYCHHSVWIDR